MPYPLRLSYEEAITYYLTEVGPSLAKYATLNDIIEQFAEFYTTTRIDGATPEFDQDMICIEIGCYSQIVFPEPGDYRSRGDEAQTIGDSKQLQVSIRRTVHPCDALPDGSEFDDDAFEMFFDTYFGEMDDASLRGFMECISPDQLVATLRREMTVKPLRDLLSRSPESFSYAVGGAG
jgi:hypothetical protein